MVLPKNKHCATFTGMVLVFGLLFGLACEFGSAVLSGATYRDFPMLKLT